MCMMFYAQARTQALESDHSGLAPAAVCQLDGLGGSGRTMVSFLVNMDDNYLLTELFAMRCIWL